MQSLSKVVIFGEFVGINLSTGSTNTFRWCNDVGWAPGDSDDQYDAYLITDSLSVSRSLINDPASSESGSIGGLLKIDVSHITILNNEVNGERVLMAGTDINPSIDGYEFSGQSYNLYYLEANPDGSFPDYSTKTLFSSGVVGKETSFGLYLLDLPLISAVGRLFSHASPHYRGFGAALGFDGTNDNVNLGDILNPTGDFALQVWVFAEFLTGTGANSVKLIDKNKWSLTYGRFTAGNIYYFQFTVTISGVAKSAFTYLYNPDFSIRSLFKRFYLVSCRYDSTTGNLNCIVDDGSIGDPQVGISVGGAPDTDTSNLRLGSDYAGTGSFYEGVMGEWRFFDESAGDVPSLDQLIAYAFGPLRGDEEGLTAYYPGLNDLASAGTTLADIGPSYVVSSDSSPLDGTISGCIEAHSLEGGLALIGNNKPISIGLPEHVNGRSVDDGAFFIYQYHCGLSQGIALTGSSLSVHPRVGVFDSGKANTYDTSYENIYDFFANPPASSGKYTICPPIGCYRLYEKSNGRISSSLWGASSEFYGLQFNGTSSYLDGTSAGFPITAFDSSSFSMSWDLVLPSWGNAAETLWDNRSASGGFKITIARDSPGTVYSYFESNEIFNPRVQIAHVTFTYGGTGFGGSTHTNTADVPTGHPIRLSLLLSRSGGNVTSKWFVNGYQVGSDSTGVEPFLNVADVWPIIGADQGTASGFAAFQLSRLMIDFTGTLAEIRQTHLSHTLIGTSWHYASYGYGDDTTHWGLLGGGSAVYWAMTNVTRTGGVAYPDLHAAVGYLMEERGLAHMLIDTSVDTDGRWELPDDPIGFLHQSDDSVDTVVALLLTGVLGYVAPNRETPGYWYPGQIQNPALLTAVDDILQEETIESQVPIPKSPHPPSAVEATYRPIWSTWNEGDIDSTASADVRAFLLSKDARSIIFNVPGGSTYYSLHEKPLQIFTLFIERFPAQVEAERQADLFATRRRIWEVPIIRGFLEERGISPALAVNWYHKSLPNGFMKFLVLAYRDHGVNGAILTLGLGDS